MPNFVYKAKKDNAETVEGHVEARDREDAIERIHQLNLIPVSVVESGLAAQQDELTRAGHVKRKEVYLFSRQLVNLIKAGVPILRALEITAQQTKSAYFKKVIEKIRFGVQEGSSFSECLAQYPRIFPSIYIALVKAGEESSRLKESISAVAEFQQRQLDFDSKVRMAMAYPLFMGIVGLGTVIFILTFVMPKVTVLFKTYNQELPLSTLIVMKAGELLAMPVFWLGIFLAFVALSFIWSHLNKAESFRFGLSQSVLKIPFYGEFWLKVEITRFVRTLVLLLESGIPITRAIKLAIPVVENVVIRNELSQCQEELVAGGSFASSVKGKAHIPEFVGQLIIIGEESGALNETLVSIVDSYEGETQEQIKVMTTLIEPVIILLVGMVIGFIVIAMLMPIFQLNVFG